MHFFYDAQSRPAMVEFGDNIYTYVHNLQGDIVGILDSAGALVVEYKYDAWGKPIARRSLTTAYEALGRLNPFRYRGYVWDEETELYYLRSRYYNPAWERFINADALVKVFTLFGNDSFSYCHNVPTSYSDLSGKNDYYSCTFDENADHNLVRLNFYVDLLPGGYEDPYDQIDTTTSGHIDLTINGLTYSFGGNATLEILTEDEITKKYSDPMKAHYYINFEVATTQIHKFYDVVNGMIGKKSSKVPGKYAVKNAAPYSKEAEDRLPKIPFTEYTHERANCRAFACYVLFHFGFDALVIPSGTTNVSDTYTGVFLQSNRENFWIFRKTHVMN